MGRTQGHPGMEHNNGASSPVQLHEMIFEYAPIGIEIYDQEGLLVDANRKCLEIFGVTDFSHIKSFKLFADPSISEENRSVLRKGSSIHYEAPFDFDLVTSLKLYPTSKTGGAFLDVTIEPIKKRQGHAACGYLVLVQDITARRQLEQMQKIQHELVLDLDSCVDLHQGLNRVLKAVLQLECIDCGGIYLADPHDGSLDLAAHHGLSDEFVALVTHFDRDSSRVRMAMAGEPRYGTYAGIFPDADDVRSREGLRAFATIPIMCQGRLVALLNLASHSHDTVPPETRSSLETMAYQIGNSLVRLRTDDALRESEEIFRQFMDHSPVYVFFKDENIRPIRLSSNYEKMLGRPVSELLGKTMDELFPSDLAKKMVADDLRILNEGKQISVDEELNGRYYTTIKFPIHIQGKPRYLAGYTIDITERRKTEENLEESERTYRMLAANLPAVVYRVFLRKNNTMAFFNDMLGKITGYRVADLAEGEVCSIDPFILPEDRPSVVEAVQRAVRENRQFDVEYRFRCKDGSVRMMHERGTPVMGSDGHPLYIDGVIFDDTERWKAEEERLRLEKHIQQTQKLEALGVLAGGIAHDFNNLLGGILGYVDLARLVSKEAETVDYLQTTLNTINRARGLTQQLLTFAKGGAPVQKITPMVRFIQETAQFALSGSNVSCRFNLPDDLWPCDIDRNQIGQVIDNIIINAQQAMPNGGTIDVTARNTALRDEEHVGLAGGRYVKVSITDFGIGIPADIMPRIFDPFYTTKSKGHGLGLATSYSIISRHGGAIDVESEQGNGSTFHFYLPASSGLEQDETVVPAAHRGCGTIIVMDDEEVMREILRMMLTALGYSVVCSKNGREALDFFIQETEAHRPVAAMFLDLTVPGGMGGTAVVAEIRKSDREIPVFVASGYADDSVMKEPAAYGFTASICKPFTVSDLSEMLNRHMRQSPGRLVGP